MPLYDFKCRDCAGTFEVLAAAGETVECPSCGGQNVERMLSAPGQVGVKTPGGGMQCGAERACCGATEPCGKPGCHK